MLVEKSDLIGTGILGDVSRAESNQTVSCEGTLRLDELLKGTNAIVKVTWSFSIPPIEESQDYTSVAGKRLLWFLRRSNDGLSWGPLVDGVQNPSRTAEFKTLIGVSTNAMPMSAGQPDEAILKRLHKGMLVMQFEEVIGKSANPRPNPTPHNSISDYDFDGWCIIADIDNSPLAPAATVRDYSVVRDGLTVRQREDERAKNWSAWVEAHQRNVDNRTPTPEAIFASLVSDVAALATNYLELAGFAGYAKDRESRLNISFCRNLNPVTTKRNIRPSDFGEHGILLQFVLDDGSNPMQATADMVTYFPNLKRTLYADVVLWENASPELKSTLEGIVAKHKEMLRELDKRTAKRGRKGE